MSFLTSMFKTEKPVIGMLHLRPLPGDPLYYPGGSVSQVVEAASAISRRCSRAVSMAF